MRFLIVGVLLGIVIARQRPHTHEVDVRMAVKLPDGTRVKAIPVLPEPDPRIVGRLDSRSAG